MKHSIRRSKTFTALIQQECGWFDDENHSTGALSARLTDDAGDLQSVCLDQGCSSFQKLTCDVIPHRNDRVTNNFFRTFRSKLFM